MNDDHHTITLKLTPLTGSDGLRYVQEDMSGSIGTTLWGPIPLDLVQRFMAERKEWFESSCKLQQKLLMDRLADGLGMNYNFPVVGDTAAPNPRPHPDGGQDARAGSHEGAEPPGLEPYRRHEI
jgi:hypothetical protein